MDKQSTVKKIPVIALLIAIEFILTRFLSITLPGLRLSFGFLPVSLVGILYGPLWAAGAYALGDVVGAVLIPSGTGAYFPGFTITAFLVGLTYGLFLYKKPVSWRTVLPATLIVCIILNLGLDSVWLYMILGDGFWAFLPGRVAKAAIMIPLQLFLIPLIWNKVILKVFPQSSQS